MSKTMIKRLPNCQLISALCLMLAAHPATPSGCISGDNTVNCYYMQVRADEPIQVDPSVSPKSVAFTSVNGSIGIATLSPCKDTEELMIYASNIDEVEEGALCSLPKLNDLKIVDNRHFPTLTKEILKGCSNIKKFKTYGTAMEEGSLDEMTEVEDLEVPLLPSFHKKETFAPLQHVRSLFIRAEDLEEVDPGVICSSPVLEEVYFRDSIIRLTEGLFANCNSLKKVTFYGRQAIIVEGEKPFSNTPNLEHLLFLQVGLKHVTKDLLTGLQNLKYLRFYSTRETEIDQDALTGLTSLKNLFMTFVALEDADLEAIHNLENLVSLELVQNDLKSLDALGELPNLELLDVSFNEITKLDLYALKKKFPKLKELKLKKNPLDPAFVEELTKEETLKVEFRSCPPLYLCEP